MIACVRCIALFLALAAATAIETLALAEPPQEERAPAPGAIRPAVPADAPPALPPRTVYDVTRLLDEVHPDPKKIDAIRAIADAVPPADLGGPDLIAFLARRADAEEHLGLLGRAIEDRRKLVELTRGDILEQRYLSDLAALETLSGNPRTGLELRLAVLASKQHRQGFIVPTYAVLSINAASMGDIDAAKSYLAQAEAMRLRLDERRKGQKRRAWVDALWSAIIEHARGAIASGEGKFDQAVAHYANGVALMEQDVTTAEVRYERVNGAPPPFSSTRAQNLIEAGYVDALLHDGKRLDAEVVVRQSLQRTLTDLGADSPQAGVMVAEFARVLLAQGRWRESLAIAGRALDIMKRAGVPPESHFAMRARLTLINTLFANGSWEAACHELDVIHDAMSSDPVLTRFAHGSAIQGIVYVKTGRPALAVAQLEPLVALYSKNFGAAHYDVGELRAVLGMAWADAGEPGRGLHEMHEAISILLAQRDRDPDVGSKGLRRIKLRIILDAYIGLLTQVRDTAFERSEGLDAVAEGFRVADAARRGSVQDALAESAARAAAGEPGLKDLIRKEQDLKQEAAALYGFLVRMMSAPVDQQLPKVMTDMRARTRAIATEREKLFAEIEKRFPAYAELISPHAATLAEASRALKPDEALVSIFSTYGASYVWAVNAAGERSFHTSKLGEPDIRRAVALLRRSLDPGDVDLVQIPRFDLETAWRLYAELLAPAESVWGKARTMVLCDAGALAQLPLALLPTAEPSPAAAAASPAAAQPVLFEELARVPWLARRVAIASVPSVMALARLRALPAAAADREPFAGFGDPQFTRATAASTTPSGHETALRRLLINRVGFSDSAKLAAPDWTRYGDLTPLPDTRVEILSIARVLGADPKRDVFLGEQANKRTVESMDLSHRRIVAFATHGLIPGDLPGLTEPALALSVLDDPKDSPLLTLDDVLGLKLDADWVVLSACNTAAGDGQGAEAVSGLGRGFFYAGTRALLVTHWPVETESAKLITTGLFERYAKDPSLSRAQALNGAMLALIDRVHRDEKGNADFSYALPLFWAPYALIGDGGR